MVEVFRASLPQKTSHQAGFFEQIFLHWPVNLGERSWLPRNLDSFAWIIKCEWLYKRKRSGAVSIYHCANRWLLLTHLFIPYQDKPFVRFHFAASWQLYLAKRYYPFAAHNHVERSTAPLMRFAPPIRSWSPLC